MFVVTAPCQDYFQPHLYSWRNKVHYRNPWKWSAATRVAGNTALARTKVCTGVGKWLHALHSHPALARTTVCTGVGKWLHALHSHPALQTTRTMPNLPARHSRDQWAPCRPSDSLRAVWAAACSPSSWPAWRTARSSCTAKHRVTSPKNLSLAQNSTYIRLCGSPPKWNAICPITSVNWIHFSCHISTPHPPPPSNFWPTMLSREQRVIKNLILVGSILCWLPWSDTCFATCVAHQWPPEHNGERISARYYWQKSTVLLVNSISMGEYLVVVMLTDEMNTCLPSFRAS